MSEPRYLTYAEQEAALAEKDKRLASLQEIVEHYLRCRSFGEPTNFSNEYKDWKERKQ